MIPSMLPPLEDAPLVEVEGGVQCLDPLWAARALRQALCGLAWIEDVRVLIQEKAPAMLPMLDDIINMTHDLCTFEPPEIEEEP